MTAQLSVNINKVATLRNSRGGTVPSLKQAIKTVLAAGARGITIHPRADERHITRQDIFDVGEFLAEVPQDVEFNIEGDTRLDLMDAVCEVAPHQCTLVPVRPGEVTSEAGWDPKTPVAPMRALVERLQKRRVRVSIFVDPTSQAVRWAQELGADRVELYTEPYAKAFARGTATGIESFKKYAAVSELAHSCGLGVNAGHDLDAENLVLFRGLPHLAEVSIGHALISQALFDGLDTVVRRYLHVLSACG